MKALRVALAVLTITLTGCPSPGSTPGETGPQGPKGDTGAAGPAGAPGEKGDKGDKGDTGATGDTGPAGATGATGATGAPGAAGAAGPQGQPGAQGPQGLQGPAGSVLVLDGGVVTGPAGASVAVTPIAPGGNPCPWGGVRVTQLSDGGITNVCNGAPGDAGAQGPQGPAGPQGNAGATGAAGASPTATTLAPLSPQCAAGGILITMPDGGSFPLCNGAQGAAGPQGMTGNTGATGNIGPQGPAGPTGPQGPAGNNGTNGAQGTPGATGPQGPQGPAGSVLYLDGGIVLTSGPQPISFAGLTPTTYTGNLGTRTGANALCDAAFAGSHFCTDVEYDSANATVTVPASGAWVDYGLGNTTTRYVRAGTSSQDTTTCGGWTISGNAVQNTSGSYYIGRQVTSFGEYRNTAAPVGINGGCGDVRPIACCRGGTDTIFRGFTPTTFTGNLGTRTGANASCQAAFAGSHFCSDVEFDRANAAVAVPASGAWVDYGLGNTTTRYVRAGTSSQDTTTCGGWTISGNAVQNTSGSYYIGRQVTPFGEYRNTAAPVGINGGCGDPRPIACCQTLQ